MTIDRDIHSWNGDWDAPWDGDWTGREDAEWPSDLARAAEDEMGGPDWILFYAMLTIAVATLVLEILAWVIQ